MKRFFTVFLFLLLAFLLYFCTDDVKRITDNLDFMRVEFSKCIGCNECIENFECPVNAIKSDDKKGVVFIDADKCIDCGLCKDEFECPQAAFTKANDTLAPGKIGNIVVIDSTFSSISLQIPRTGDDNEIGDAYKYILKYSDSVIDENNFELVTTVLDTFFRSDYIDYTIAELESGKKYYFAARAYDEMDNHSDITYFSAFTPENDTTPPAMITDLIAEGLTSTTCILSWNAVGDDDMEGRAISYEIRKSNENITEENWQSAEIIENNLVPKNSGEKEEFLIENLENEHAYFFAIKTIDNTGNISPLSNILNVTTLDEIAPNRINDLYLAIESIDPAMIKLQWTAVGDDNNNGIVSAYEIKRSTEEITDANWANAESVSFEGEILTAGSTQELVLEIEKDVEFFFAIKAVDNALNKSEISNSPSIIIESGSSDDIPPAQILDLSIAITDAETGEIKLQWTAPGDDENLGTATNYKIRKHIEEITSDNWAQATDIANTISPAEAGNTESFTTHINFDETVYFAIVTYDDNLNASLVSNSPNIYIPEPEDTIAPSAITDLAAAEISNKANNVRLSWTSVGDDNNIGTATGYVIKKYTSEITDSNWELAETVTNSILPQESGNMENFDLEIEYDVAIYFAIKTFDENDNYSSVSNSPSITIDNPNDSIAPSAITNLSVSYGLLSYSNRFTVTWTAPGDDGTSGTADHYVMKYSHSPITESNWSSCSEVSGLPEPSSAGTSQNTYVSGFAMGDVLYLAIKTYDEVGNESEISNIPYGKLIYEIDPSPCTACGHCWPCPEDALDSHPGYFTIDLDNCTQCGDCYSRCPRNAIKKKIVEMTKR